MPKNVPIYPQLQDAVTEVLRSTDAFFGDLVARTGQTKKGRVLLELLSVKQSHGKTRREALRELDRVVTELFPPVEGTPLPSEELNGKADVLEASHAGLLSGASAVYYCDPVKPSYVPAPLFMSNPCKTKRK